MKVKLELFGASRDLSNKNFLEFNIKEKISIKDFKKKIISYVDENFEGNEYYKKIIETSARLIGSPFGISLFLIMLKTFFPTDIVPEANALLKVSFFLETSTILKEFFLKISFAQSFNSS